MNTKNNQGFTLIEVMLAVAIVAMVITPIFILQASAAGNVGRKARLYDRIAAGYSFLIECTFIPKPRENDAKKISQPTAELRYGPVAVAKNSELADIAHLVVDQVKINWLDRNSKKEELVMALRYQPEEKKS